MIAPISACLSVYNNQNQLALGSDVKVTKLIKQRFLWGAPIMERIVSRLNEVGLEYSIENIKDGTGYIISIPRQFAHITLKPKSTQIFAPDDNMRMLLKAVVLKELTEISN